MISFYGGDTLLVEARTSSMQQQQHNRDFLLVHSEVPRYRVTIAPGWLWRY